MKNVANNKMFYKGMGVYMEIIRILGLDSTAIDDYDISRVEEEVVRHLLHDVSLVSDDSDSEVGSDDSEDTLILGEKKAGDAADAAAGEAGARAPRVMARACCTRATTFWQHKRNRWPHLVTMTASTRIARAQTWSLCCRTGTESSRCATSGTQSKRNRMRRA